MLELSGRHLGSDQPSSRSRSTVVVSVEAGIEGDEYQVARLSALREQLMEVEKQEDH